MKISLNLTLIGVLYIVAVQPSPLDLAQSAMAAGNIVSNPVPSCFALYSPLLSEVAETFHSKYQACLTTFNAEAANLTQQAMHAQLQLVQQTMNIHKAYEACDNDTTVPDFFNCYARVSTDAKAIISNIENNATADATIYSGELEPLEVQKNLCDSQSEEYYETHMAEIYAQLDDCLENGPPPTTSTIAPTTTTTTATTTTTTLPTASSAAPPALSSTAQATTEPPTTQPTTTQQ